MLFKSISTSKYGRQLLHNNSYPPSAATGRFRSGIFRPGTKPVAAEGTDTIGHKRLALSSSALYFLYTLDQGNNGPLSICAPVSAIDLGGREEDAMSHLLRDNLVSFNDDTAAHDVMVYEREIVKKKWRTCFTLPRIGRFQPLLVGNRIRVQMKDSERKKKSIQLVVIDDQDVFIQTDV